MTLITTLKISNSCYAVIMFYGCAVGWARTATPSRITPHLIFAAVPPLPVKRGLAAEPQENLCREGRTFAPILRHSRNSA